MQIRLFLVFLLLLPSSVGAQSVTGPTHSNAPLNITEEDGSPSTYPYKLKVSNGTLTDNGDGTVSVTTGSGGGGGGNVGIGTSGRFAIYQGSSTIGSPYNIVADSAGNVGISSINPTQKLDVKGSINASGNIGIGTTMICTGKGCPSKDIDVFLVAGQSNAQGDAEITDAQANSPIPLPDTAYQYYSSAVSVLVDPVGNATYGSAWPQFSITYNQQTGKRIGIVPAAVGGTTQYGGNVPGPGCWDDVNFPADCTLQRASITLLNAAITAFKAAGYNPTFRGVLWCQGEADATYINADLETQAQYISAFQDMITQYRTDEGATTPFYIFRTGTASLDQNAAQQQYRTVRNGQEYVASQDLKTSIVFYGAVNFPSQGYMQVANSPHYTQAGYNIMGEIGAQNVLATNQQNKASYQQGPNMIFPTNIGIGTSTPVGLGTTIPQSQVSIRASTPTGKMLTLVNGAGTKLEDHTADGVVYFGGNVGVGDPTPGSPLTVLGTFSNVGVGTFIQVSSTMTATSTGQRLFMGTFQGTANTAIGLTVTEIDGQSTNAINSGSGTLTTGIGNNASVQLIGAGNIGIAEPIKAQVTNSGSGTLTNGYPLYSKCLNTGSGTFTNCAQLYLDTNSGSYGSLFGVDQIDSAAKNYFAGNVGVGSLAPGQILDVQGTARMTNIVDTGVTASSLVATDSNKQLAAVTLTTTGSSGPSTFTSGTLNIPQYSGAAAAAGGTNAVQYNSGSSTMAGAESVFSMNGTNVGVNTTNGHASLEVVQSGSNTPFMVSSTGSSAGDVVIVTSGGNVGIGTILPQNYNSVGNSFVIAGTGNRGMLIAGGATSNATILLGSTTNPTNGRVAYAIANNVMSFFTNNTQKMTLTSAGNLGLGTSVSVNKLSIIGNVGIGTVTSSSYILTAAPNGGMIVESNVGIGSVTPGALLDVFGNTRIGNSGSLIVAGNVGINTINFQSNGTSYYTKLNVVGPNSGATTNKLIGLKSPNFDSWDINARDTASKAFLDIEYSNNGAMLTLDSNGNIGINNTAPAKTLDFVGQTRINYNGSTNAPSLIVGSGINNAGMNYIAADDSITINTGNTATATFLGSNVGVGSASPGATLDVNGSIRSVTGGSVAVGACWCTTPPKVLGYCTGVLGTCSACNYNGSGC